MKKYDVVLFDFDGTVADTGPGIKNSVRYALEKKGIPVGDEKKLDYFIGPPLYVGFADMYGVNEEESNELVDIYREYYSEKGVFEVELYPGVLELARELKENDIKVAIASSKPKHFLDVVIPYLGADDVFNTIVGPELNNHKSDKSDLIKKALMAFDIKPSKRCAMIGDRFYDINGANKAGVTSIGVIFGYGNRKEFEEAGANFIAENVEELENILL